MPGDAERVQKVRWLQTEEDEFKASSMVKGTTAPPKKSHPKDACYAKVKRAYADSAWPSAYASGALVQCRKVGAAKWGASKIKTILIVHSAQQSFPHLSPLSHAGPKQNSDIKEF